MSCLLCISNFWCLSPTKHYVINYILVLRCWKNICIVNLSASKFLTLKWMDDSQKVVIHLYIIQQELILWALCPKEESNWHSSLVSLSTTSFTYSCPVLVPTQGSYVSWILLSWSGTTDHLTSYLIGWYYEMPICLANYDKALKLIHETMNMFPQSWLSTL